MKKSLTMLLSLGLGLCAMFKPDQAEALFASIKATGMAQVGAAYAQDTECVAFNPAGLVEVGDRVDLGIAALCLHQEFELEGNLIGGGILNGKRDAAVGPWIVNPHFGVSMCLCPDLVVGFTIYNNAYVSANYGSALPLIGTTNQKLQYIQEIIASTVAYRINDVHSVGLSLDIAVQRFRAQGLESFAPLSSSPGSLTNNGTDYSAGVGVTIGWLGQFYDWLSVGVSFQPQIQMGRLHKYKGLIADRGRLNAPATLVGGITISPMPCWDIVFDVREIWYGDVRSLANRFRLPTSLSERAGEKSGPGFGWTDQTFYRFGTAYQARDDLTVRAGYRYGTGSIPASQTAPNLLTMETVKHVISVGASWQYDCDTEFSFYYSHGFKSTVNGDTPIPFPGGGFVNISQAADLFGFEIGKNF